MKGFIQVGRNRIHTSFHLFRPQEDEEGIRIVIEDKNSEDRLVVTLTPENIQKMKAAIERFEKLEEAKV